MPVQSISFSNENYAFVVKRADIRKVGFSKVVNQIIDDARLLEKRKTND